VSPSPQKLTLGLCHYFLSLSSSTEGSKYATFRQLGR
jgi:hypothetical protein